MRINELNTVASISYSDNLALDTGDMTGKVDVKALGRKITEDAAPTFTSGDSSTATSWTEVAAVTSGLLLKNILNRITTMMKNVRFLYNLLGTTDISGIGGGTVTGAISKLNTDLSVTNYTSQVTLNETPVVFGCYKMGHIVLLTILGEGKARSEGQVVFTLPSACRPLANWQFVAYVSGVPLVMQINSSNGNCLIYYGSSYPTGRIYFDVTFPTA